jgi:hypothetical protein
MCTPSRQDFKLFQASTVMSSRQHHSPRPMWTSSAITLAIVSPIAITYGWVANWLTHCTNQTITPLSTSMFLPSTMCYVKVVWSTLFSVHMMAQENEPTFPINPSSFSFLLACDLTPHGMGLTSCMNGRLALCGKLRNYMKWLLIFSFLRFSRLAMHMYRVRGGGKGLKTMILTCKP